MIIQSDFNFVVDKFAKLEDARDELWQNARKLLLDGYEIEAYILILSTWNFADFRYFLKHLNLKNFNKTITEINPVFNKLNNINFNNADFNDSSFQKDIKIIYGKLKNIVRQTGASKVMALKRPDLFVMWDTDIRRMYKIENKANPEHYIEFLIKIKNEFCHMNWDDKEIPFAKAIDQYNYAIVEEKRREKKNRSKR